MPFVPRMITDTLIDCAEENPAVILQGPRQCGKTSLLQATFPDYSYITLRNPSHREFATDDPETFLSRQGTNVIIDDMDLAPGLLEVLVNFLNPKVNRAEYIFSSSVRCTHGGSRSIHGNVPVLTLLPLSLAELDEASIAPDDADAWIEQGGFPTQLLQNDGFCAEYLRSFILPDLKEAREIDKLNAFDKFVGVCASHMGKPLNMQALVRESGINTRTAMRWLQILQDRFIVHLIQPYQEGSRKRQAKSPVLYFIDTGLLYAILCSLATKKSALINFEQQLFNNAIINEIAKSFHMEGRMPQISQFRDTQGCDIPVLVQMSEEITLAIATLASEDYTPRAFANMDKIAPMLDIPREQRMLVYEGEAALVTNHGRLVPYYEIS